MNPKEAQVEPQQSAAKEASVAVVTRPPPIHFRSKVAHAQIARQAANVAGFLPSFPRYPAVLRCNISGGVSTSSDWVIRVMRLSA